MNCPDLLEKQKASGICCHIEEDVANTEIILVGFFAAVEIGAFHFQAQVGFEVYAAALNAVAVGVEEAVGGASGHALQDVVAGVQIGCGETAGGLGSVDIC